MASCCRYLPRAPQYRGIANRLTRVGSRHSLQIREFHDYWTQKSPTGLSLRIPVLKARHHLGALSSRGDRAENEDRFQVGVMNKLSETEEHQPFYFAIIDGYVLYLIVG